MKTITQSTSVEHIDTIIADIQEHIDKKLDFVGFVLIALGIEFLGSFMDDKSFNDYGQSESRFRNGIKFFKNQWYKTNAKKLFQSFRGPLIHQYRIGEGLLITSNCKNGAPKTIHLQDVEGNTLLVLEQLFDDFKAAAQKFKNEATKSTNSFNKEKLTQVYQSIIGISLPTQIPQISLSSTTQSHTTMILPAGTITKPGVINTSSGQ